MKLITTIILVFATCTFLQAGTTDTVVYLFLLEDCVICQSLMPEINELNDNYGSDYQFIGLFPNKRSKYKTIEEFENKYSVRFETKTDHYKVISTKLNAAVTPEVVIYDTTNERSLYQGAVNDEYVRIGKRRRVITKHYLQEVLLHLSDPKYTIPDSNDAIGCLINFKE